MLLGPFYVSGFSVPNTFFIWDSLFEKMKSAPNTLEVGIFTDPESNFIGFSSDLRNFI